MQTQEGDRNWERWRQLKVRLDEAYKVEKEYWRKKSKINWLKERDRNTKFFHLTIAKRKKRNRIDWLLNDKGVEQKGNKAVAREITKVL